MIELVLGCVDPRCDALSLEPPATLFAGTRWPFDIVIDNRTPHPIELRWYAARDGAASGRAELGPGRHPLPPHFQASHVPVCVDVVDPRGRVRSTVIERAAACE